MSAISQAIRQVDAVGASLRPELRDAYFAAVEYPVKAAFAMARKTLEAQRARSFCLGQGDERLAGRMERAEPHAVESMMAHREIQRLTEQYNTVMSGGKWNGLMDASPRDLPVFRTPSLPLLPDCSKPYSPAIYTDSGYAADSTFVAVNACDYTRVSGSCETVEMLGHSMKAVALAKGSAAEYEFETLREGEALLHVALIPTQANDKGDIRFSVSVDGGEPAVFSLKEKFRSETWKENVLRGQALRSLPLDLGKGRHRLTIKALDAHIILDQWMVDFDTRRKFYVFPVKSALGA